MAGRPPPLPRRGPDDPFPTRLSSGSSRLRYGRPPITSPESLPSKTRGRPATSQTAGATRDRERRARRRKDLARSLKAAASSAKASKDGRARGKKLGEAAAAEMQGARRHLRKAFENLESERILPADLDKVAEKVEGLGVGLRELAKVAHASVGSRSRAGQALVKVEERAVAALAANRKRRTEEDDADQRDCEAAVALNDAIEFFDAESEVSSPAFYCAPGLAGLLRF